MTLTSEGIREVELRTEGWMAGWQLLALPLRGGWRGAEQREHRVGGGAAGSARGWHAVAGVLGAFRAGIRSSEGRARLSGWLERPPGGVGGSRARLCRADAKVLSDVGV